MNFELHPLRGPAILNGIPDLARLRIAVFREWPYLYEGSPADEYANLARYADSPDALVIIAKTSGQTIGAATAMPMSAADPLIRDAMADAGFAPVDTLYFGESVILPDWRGRGLGTRLFIERERHADALGLPNRVFCRILRDDADPRRPADARDLAGFWKRMGYAAVGRRINLDWPEIGNPSPIAHPMEFWAKSTTSCPR